MIVGTSDRAARATTRVRAFSALLVAALIVSIGAILFWGPTAQAESSQETETSSTAAPADASVQSNNTTPVQQANAIRVAFFPLDGFYEYDASGNMSGYGYEYFNAVADASNIPYEYVPASSWVEALEMFDQGKIDVLAPSEMTAERSEKYRFCPLPIGMEYGSLLTLNSNDSLTYEDYDSFNGLNVGCVESIVFMDGYLDYQQNNGFNTHLVYYKDTAAVLAALNAGEVDAVMVNLMVKTDDMKVLAKFGAAPIYYMVPENNAQLQETLNDALQVFTTSNPSFQSQLTDKYFASFNEAPFTKQEMDFTASSRVVNVGIARSAAPLAHIDDDGKACGVDVDILNAIAQNSGMKFKCVALPDGVVDEAYLIDNNIAMVAGVEVNTTNGKRTEFRLTKPYQTLAKVYVGNKAKAYDMNSSLKVAVAAMSGDGIAAFSAEHPNHIIMSYNTTEECLDAVERGDADIALQNRYIIERCLGNPHYENLGILPVESIPADYAFGLVDSVIASSYGAQNVDLFKSVIDKSITQIPEQTISEFVSNEVIENQYHPSVTDLMYQYRGQLLVIGLSLLCVIAALLYAMRIQIRNKKRILDNEQKLANITNNINGGVLVINGDDSLLITYANDGFLDLIGCSRREFEKVHHNSYLTYVHPEDADTLKDLASRPVPKGGERVSFPVRLQRADGTYLNALFNGTIRHASDGSRQMYCVIADISEQVELLNELTLEKSRADLFFQKSDNVIYEVNLKDKTITTSDNMLAMLGWTLPTSLKQTTRDEFMLMWRTDDESKTKLFDATKDLLSNITDVKCVVPLQTASGNSIWCEIDQYPVVDKEGHLVSVVGRILDVDDAMAEKEQLQHLARTDSMTGLLKKEPFVEAAREYLNQDSSDNCALLFFDVDHFKEVNDTLGHEMGDECLNDVAKKLSVSFASADLVGRSGGDEFVVFVKDIPRDTLEDRLTWLLERLKDTYSNGKTSLAISCSIGAACTQDFGRAYEQLLAHADAALYEAKETGRARVVMAKPDKLDE